MMKRLMLAASLAVVLAGCAGVPQTPAQGVFAAKQTAVGARQAAVAYARLPGCSTPAQQPCSSAAAVTQIQKADKVAEGAIDAAEAAVRTPGFGKDVAATAITTANAALTALLAILANVGAK